jgi:DNA polymerase-3 subunit gamma/tau
LHGRGELGLAPDEYAALTMVLLRLLAFKPESGNAAPQEKKTLKVAPRPLPEAPKPAKAVAPASHLSAVPSPVPVATPPSSPVHGFLPEGHRLPVRHMPGALVNAQTHAQGHPQATPHVSAAVEGPGSTPDSARDRIEKFRENEPLAHIYKAQVATNIEALQVHVQPDPIRDVPTERGALAVPTSLEGDFWYATVQALVAAESITAMVRELALQAQLVARDTDQWLLRVERESLNQPGSRDRLAVALAGAGYPVKLVAEVGRVSDSPAKRNAVAAAERQLAAEKIVFDDPLVQTLMRDFGAKIVPGSIKPGQSKTPG